MIVITSRETGRGTTEITVRGDLDSVAAVELRRALLGVGSAAVELDLSQVEFLDCAGARTLLWADEHLRAREGTLTVVRPSRLVMRLLRLIEFDQYLSIEWAVGAGSPAPGD
ncbi:STAS domain-containing protein [Planobispora siamensis]|uniref:STAS domain-containing protein n=1 Tax=Planobispora siamensis TaxID=936338 RepID=A0A8J3SLE1_9ACTN|nr:STAS domain-containing protein [Planobispora siamensis]GIH96578.1 hypothetical protein Psi01_72080 [Planobispora siamensis]